VFKPFFVTLNYPYSVIRGETLSLQAVVFNYQTKSVEAEILLENDKNEFEFVGIESNEVGGKKLFQTNPAKSIHYFGQKSYTLQACYGKIYFPFFN
jgi:hypothetical protein